MNVLRRWPLLLVAMMAIAILAIGAACGDDDDDSNPTATTGADETTAPGEATDVAVTLQEWSIVLDKNSVPAGTVNFNITNDGPDHTHEFVVVKTDLAPGDLPTNADGSVDEEQVDGVDEAEDVEPGASTTLTVDLEPGKYVLMCNRIDDEGASDEMVHYMLGMRTEFTVE